MERLKSNANMLEDTGFQIFNSYKRNDGARGRLAIHIRRSKMVCISIGPFGSLSIMHLCPEVS